MAWTIRNHEGLQGGFLALIAAGAVVGALGAFTGIEHVELWLAAVVGSTALVVVGAEVALAAVGDARARRVRRALVAWLGVTGGLALAWASIIGLVWADALPDSAGLRWTTGGGLFGLIAGLGLLPVFLVRSQRDRVGAALAAARGQSMAESSPEEWALVQRAAAAHRRAAEGLAADASAEARELRNGSTLLTLQVIDLAGRCRDLRQELAAVDGAEIDGRGAALQGAAGATEDPAARADFARAAQANAELGDRLRALRGAHDRLRARLSFQVSVLESTALAVSARRASSLAQQAASLAPLVDRLRESGGELEAEALAVAEAPF